MSESTKNPVHLEMTLAINKTDTKETVIKNLSGKLAVFVVASDDRSQPIQASIIGAAPPSTLLVVLEALSDLQQSIVKGCLMAALPWLLKQMEMLRENPISSMLDPNNAAGHNVIDVPTDDPFGQAISAMFKDAVNKQDQRTGKPATVADKPKQHNDVEAWEPDGTVEAAPPRPDYTSEPVKKPDEEDNNG